MSAAPKPAMSADAEMVPVAWEFRHFDPLYESLLSEDAGWSAWERVKPQHRLETVEEKVEFIRECIKRGNKYQLRALYTKGEPEGYTPSAKERP